MKIYWSYLHFFPQFYEWQALLINHRHFPKWIEIRNQNLCFSFLRILLNKSFHGAIANNMELAWFEIYYRTKNIMKLKTCQLWGRKRVGDMYLWNAEEEGDPGRGEMDLINTTTLAWMDKWIHKYEKYIWISQNICIPLMAFPSFLNNLGQAPYVRYFLGKYR